MIEYVQGLFYRFIDRRVVSDNLEVTRKPPVCNRSQRSSESNSLYFTLNTVYHKYQEKLRSTYVCRSLIIEEGGW